MMIKEEEVRYCPVCNHAETLHHANEIQSLCDGTQFHRTCYGIACICGQMFASYPHIPRTTKKIKKKKHWILRFLKRQKIQLDIKIKRTRKKLLRKYIKLRNMKGGKVNES